MISKRGGEAVASLYDRIFSGPVRVEVHGCEAEAIAERGETTAHRSRTSARSPRMREAT